LGGINVSLVGSYIFIVFIKARSPYFARSPDPLVGTVDEVAKMERGGNGHGENVCLDGKKLHEGIVIAVRNQLVDRVEGGRVAG